MGLCVEFAGPPVLLPIDMLSVSLSEAMETGREIVSTEEVRRMILPMRADHFGLVLELLRVMVGGTTSEEVIGWGTTVP